MITLMFALWTSPQKSTRSCKFLICSEDDATFLLIHLSFFSSAFCFDPSSPFLASLVSGVNTTSD